MESEGRKMREIKFRGKSGGGKWVYGDLASSRYGNPCIGGITKIWSVVKKDTVGQYTGMKDSNEKEVYEGDIVSTYDEDEELATIEWGDDTLKFMVTHGNVCSDLGEYYPREIEVIGNIYDNPELLGGARK